MNMMSASENCDLSLSKPWFVSNGFSLQDCEIPDCHWPYLSEVLIRQSDLKLRISELARDVLNLMQGEDFTALGVLAGCYKFYTELLDNFHQTDAHVTTDFIRVSSYRNDVAGKIKVISEPMLESIRNKNVLVVEDIIDTGATMKFLINWLQVKGAKHIVVAILSMKRRPVIDNYRPDLLGFELPDEFVVGCGYDFNNYFRNLHHVCSLSEEGKRKYRKDVG